MANKVSNPDSETNIRRIDTKGTHGFQVHFDRKGTIYTKFFSDSAYEGKEGAKKQARIFRDELKSAIPSSSTGIPAWGGKARSNTGKMGVSFSKEIRDGVEVIIVQATVRAEKNYSVNKKFRLNGLSLEAGIDLAAQWRDEMIKERIAKEAMASE